MKKFIALYLLFLSSGQSFGQISSNDQDSIILNDAAVKLIKLMNNSDYLAATLSGEEAKIIANNRFGINKSTWNHKNVSNYYLICSYLGTAYISLGNNEKAIENLGEALPYQKYVYGDNSIFYARTLSTLGNLYNDVNKIKEADNLFAEVRQIRNNALKTDSCFKILALINKAQSYGLPKDSLAALGYLYYALDSAIKNNWEHPCYPDILNALGEVYYAIGSNVTANGVFDALARNTKDFFGIHSIEYNKALRALADICVGELEYNKADSLFSEVISNCNYQNYNDSTHYAAFLSDYSRLCRFMANYQKSEQLGLKALQVKETLYPGGKHTEYTTQLDNLSILYLEIGNYSAAEKLLQKSLSIKKEMKGENTVDFAHTLSYLGLLYYYKEDYSKAENVQLKVLDNFERNNIKGQEYENALAKLGMIYRDENRYKECEKILLELVTRVKQRLGENHPDYAIATKMLADYYYEVGLKDKAFTLYLNASNILKISLGETHPDYASSLMDLGKCYDDSRQCEKAIYCDEIALSILNKQSRLNKYEYCTSIENLACAYGGCSKNYSKADSLFSIAISIEKDLYGRGRPKLINNIASNYRCMGEIKKAIALFSEAKNDMEQNEGKKGMEYRDNLFGLINAYLQENEYDFAEPLIKEHNTIVNSQIEDDFAFFSEKEKLQLIYNTDYSLQFFNSYLIKQYSHKPQLADISYNNELLYKGFILRNVLQLKNIIENSKDSNLVNKYNELKVIKMKLSKIYSNSNQPHSGDLTQLQNRQEQLEKYLESNTLKYVYGVNRGKLSSSNLKQKINDNDVCVEFIKVGNYVVPPSGISILQVGDRMRYYALILCKKFPHPRLVYLFMQYEIDSLLGAESIVDCKSIDKLYDIKNIALKTLLWGKIDSSIGNVKNIYIAQTGSINGVNISAIPYDEKTTVGEKYNLHILGTTAGFIGYDPTYISAKTTKQAIVYGGIDYDRSTRPLTYNVPKENNIGYPQVAEIASRSAIAKFSYLPGTKEEAKNVQQLCNTNSMIAISFTGENATEASFKLLSGKKEPFILHIATHGYFFPDPQQANQEKSSQNFSSEMKNVFKWSDDPLLRSGLIFAGANHTWGKTDYVSDSTEDEILTSYEISNLDLSNCQLVVLSACETGLGDIKGSEGVFGLQRAFKMAGVKNIIMSLWKVPDAQTSELMTSFYSYCFAGKSVHDALQAAQTEMKKKYPPYYWAGFKLLE